MKKITDLCQYSGILDKCQKEIPDLIYNHLMLPMEAEHYIKNNKLYYREQEDGIVFYVVEKDFCKLYCFLSGGAGLSLPSENKPLLIEYIWAEGREDPNVQRLKQKMESFGFCPYVENKRRRAVIRQENLIPLVSGRLREDLLWRYASKADARDIYDLWTVMDIYNSTIPAEEELAELIASGEILTVWKNGSMCGVVRVKQENKRTGSMWLMAVSNEFRRQGIATEMYKLSLSVLNEKGCRRVIEWCDEKNHAILSVSGRFGFQPDGTVAVSYIMK